MSSCREDGLSAWYAAMVPERTWTWLILAGVIKTYRLTYEAVEILRALFNKNAAKNTWTISASTLKAFGEYFGANTEQLDISSDGGRTTFTSYTEKIVNGKGLLEVQMMEFYLLMQH